MKIKIKKLRELNFGKLISVGTDPTTYSFDEYIENEYEHHPINGYCVSCEELGCNISKDDDSYILTNISHGAHSSDFFKACKKTVTSSWHHEPIMFIFESPSSADNENEGVPYDGYNKQPSTEWYWIQEWYWLYENWEPAIFPNGFNGRQYGGFVWSAALTFKLANVYVTNLVKCGLNNEEGSFQGLASFQNETIENCYMNFLKEEISIIKPRIIFAVGTNAEWWINYFVNEYYAHMDCIVQYLPHPSAFIRKEHLRTIYFIHIVRALLKAEIINVNQTIELLKLCLDRFDF